MIKFLQQSIVVMILFAIVLTVGAPYAKAQESMPPEIYVEENAHPFEGCVYRKWNVLENSYIYKEPNIDSQVVANMRPGELVQAQTGILYSHPARVVVHKYHQEKQYNENGYSGMATFNEGEVIYLIASIGEGFYKVWHNGAIETISIFGLRGADRLGAYSSGETWGTLIDKYKSEWWVKMISPDGTVGWTNQTRKFGNMDLYGGRKVFIVLNYERIEFENGQYPYIVDGCTMVELSSMAKKLKCTYSINNDVITLSTSKGTKAEIVIGTKTAFINGKIIKIQTQVVMQKNNIYLPIGLLGEILDAKIEWDAETRQVKFDII